MWYKLPPLLTKRPFITKKALFLLPLCAATAFAEEDRIITIYKPIAETDVESFVLEGGLNTQRTGTWTTNGQTKEASYRPTARTNKDALFDLPENSVTFDAQNDIIKTGDSGRVINPPDISELYIKYTTPEPATATLSLLALAGLCARRRRH